MLRRVKLQMRCTNVPMWELNRYRRQTMDDGRRTTHFKSFYLFIGEFSISPYRSGALSHLRKKNMAGKLFFVFAKIRVLLVSTYVYCTKWSCNVSLIHVKVR
jgi:hypothetical protein